MLKLFKLEDGEYINVNAIVSIQLNEEYTSYAKEKKYDVFLSNGEKTYINEKEYESILGMGGIR